MHKFNVGDLVVANENANSRYSVTREGWTGRIVEIDSNGMLAIQGEGYFWDLDPECFDLDEPEISKDELMPLLL